MLVADVCDVFVTMLAHFLPFLTTQMLEKSLGQSFLLVLSIENKLPGSGIDCFSCRRLEHAGVKWIIWVGTNCSNMTLLLNSVWHCSVAVNLRKQMGIDENM